MMKLVRMMAMVAALGVAACEGSSESAPGGGQDSGGTTSDTGGADAVSDEGGAPDEGPAVEVDEPDTAAPDTSTDAGALPGCCAKDADCGAGASCVVSAGACKEKPAEGCWTDSHCGAGDVCVGFTTCDCDNDCGMADVPGWCQKAGTGVDGNCCADDASCASGYECREDGFGMPSCAKVLKSGQCYEDSDCGAGNLCPDGNFCSCNMDCLSQLGSCGSIAGGCCKEDKDCANGGLCVSGTCGTKPDAGQCWSQGQCDAGEVCSGASLCPCNADCNGPDKLGTCLPLNAGCCAKDSDCKDGQSCAGTVCKEAPPAGECWETSDCKAGETCQGAGLCPCLAPCALIDMPGKCVTASGGCCFSDFDCDPSMVCAEGVCQPKPEKGQCWTSNDCDAGTCQNASICPCNAFCGVADQPGTCSTKPGPGCCFSDADCGDGHCATNDSGEGVCVAKGAKDACWTDADCGGEGACLGESICPCGAACFVADKPGECVPMGEGCCQSSATCAEGQICVSGEPFGTCVAAPGEGECWSDLDCSFSETCEGEMPCPCGTLCKVPGAPGTCEPLPGCCAADSDCAGDAICHGGTCLEPAPPGACYGDADCSTGETCSGGAICPCGMVCIQGTSLGKCVEGCPGENPQGCTSDAQCPDGETCTPVGACLPSSCSCDLATKSWVCTADCSGGKCTNPD